LQLAAHQIVCGFRGGHTPDIPLALPLFGIPVGIGLLFIQRAKFWREKIKGIGKNLVLITGCLSSAPNVPNGFCGQGSVRTLLTVLSSTL